jgi:hypothetical protein
MLAPEFKALLEAKGHRVIYVRVVVHDEGEKINGLDSTGEPEVRPIVDCNGKPITPTVIIPSKAIGKWYFGDDAETVKVKMQAKAPDIEKVKEDEKLDGSIVSVVRTITDLLR